MTFNKKLFDALHNPMTATIDNGDRAHWASVALAAFAELTGSDGDEGIGDLICDLLHLAAERGLDPLKTAEIAFGAYADERDYPPDGWAPIGEHAKVSITVTR